MTNKMKMTFICLFFTQTQIRISNHCTFHLKYINGLAQDCSNSTVNALELLQSWAKPSICSSHNSLDVTWQDASHDDWSNKCLLNKMLAWAKILTAYKHKLILHVKKTQSHFSTAMWKQCSNIQTYCNLMSSDYCVNKYWVNCIDLGQ